MTQISRRQYADLYGPTLGDKIRLGNSDLYVEIEKDYRAFYGDELQYGGGKTLRDGMGSDNRLTQEAGCLDLVITNVTIVDAVIGVVKADVGIHHGRIVGIGKAGNPATMDGVSPLLVTGTSTDAISGEHLILTAGGMDTHVHYISPQQVYAALSNGITTLWGGGIGPADGTNGVTSTNGPWNLEMMLRSVEGLPINFGLYGKGNCSGRGPLVEQLNAGAAGFKVHEDYGSTPSAIRAALNVAEEYDVSVAVHTDTLNEAGFVEDTIAAFDGRTIHTYHSEGAGGGHPIAILGFINFAGAKLMERMETIFNVGKLGVLGLFIVSGLLIGQLEWTRFEPAAWAPISNVIATGILGFLAYEGFELISNVSGDIEDPKRTLPIALLGSVAIAIVIYFLAFVVAIGHMSFDAVRESRDFAVSTAASTFLGPIGFGIMTVGAVLASASAINADYFGAAKLPLRLSEHDELPSVFQRAVRGQSLVSLIVIGVLALIAVNFIDIKALSAATSGGFLVVHAAVNIAAIRLRHETGTAPWIPALAFLLCLAALALMVIQFLSSAETVASAIAVVAIIVISVSIELAFRSIHAQPHAR